MTDDALTRHDEWTSPWSLDAASGSVVDGAATGDTGDTGDTVETSFGSFNDFFLVARAPMLRLAYVLTGSLSQAEEAVQESFVRVYERWSTVEDPAAYLRRAVVNRCTSWHRHRAVVRRTDADVARAESYLDQPAETDELTAALAQLPRRRRAVVVLRFYQQLELADIADTLGVSVGTVKSTLNRALAQLRGTLG